MKNYLLLVLGFILFGSTSIFSQSTEVWFETKTQNTLKLKKGATSPQAQIADLAWYTGRWMGKGFGGDIEENIGPAMGNSMIGSFRLVHDRTPIFYEFIAIVEENNTLIYKVKHFNPDLTGWETKEAYTSFPLVKIEENIVWFEGMTIKRVDDEVILYLAMKEDGIVKEEKLNMYLQQ